MRDLMHAMIATADKPALGSEGFPVERGLYSTVIAVAGLHQDRGDGTYGFTEPANTKLGRTYRPVWEAAKTLFASEDGPIRLGQLYQVWEGPPYGVRRGVMPILALAFIMAHRTRLAVYGEGQFQADIDDYLVDILLQDENLVALRRVDIDGFRGAILHGVASAIAAATDQACPADALEAARRLVRFVRDLPPWTRKTLSLSSAPVRFAACFCGPTIRTRPCS